MKNPGESRAERSLRGSISLLGLCLLLLGAAALHLASPEPFRRIVPRPLHMYAAALVSWSAVAEITCALLLLPRHTRRVGALLTAGLFIAVFPANLQMALDSGGPQASGLMENPWVAWLRLPLQVPLVWWALQFRDRAER